ncbi:MAG: VOC family protein [Gammaproteobacteria bacterium]|nr:VOC family protein [Gammaproteobacteria bacterium]
MNSPLPRKAFQFAFVVDDVDAYLRKFAALFGMETPGTSVTDPREVTHIRYLGQPTEGRARVGYIQLDNVLLELIEPIGGPSIWQACLEARGNGLHHIAFIVDGIEQVIADLEGLGLPLVQSGKFPAAGPVPSGLYAYLGGLETLGFDVELLEMGR